MTGKLKDAETCYRRAFKIATDSLPPSDPFVTTSRENLEAFCTAQGLPLTPPPASAGPRLVASAAPPPPAPPRPVLLESPPLRTASAVPGQSASWARRAVAGLVLVIALTAAIVFARGWLAEPRESKNAEPVLPPASAATVPPPVTVPAPVPDPQPAPAPEAPRATSPSSLTVVSAQVCRSLTTTGSWNCEAARSPQTPGTKYFFTRVASARNVVIEHRWYRGDRLHQQVELRVRASAAGFRTYSRNTITSEQAGTWKVELRSEDGRVLHEETFVVR